MKLLLVSQAPILARAILNSVALAAVIWMFEYWSRRQSFPRQAGEWILVSSGIWCWLNVISSYLHIPETHPRDALWLNIANGVVQSAVLAYGGYRLWSQSRAWALSLIGWSVADASRQVMASVYLLQMRRGTMDTPPIWLISAMGVVISASIVVAAVCFIIAFTSDIHRERRRGWIHATAIAWICGTIILTSLQYTHALLQLNEASGTL